MLQKIFGYKVELVEHSPEYTVVKADKAVPVGSQIPVRVSGANGRRTPAVPMVVLSCRECEQDGFLLTGRFLVDHPDLSGFEIPPSLNSDAALRSDPRVNCHLCVISRDLPGYRVMTIDLSEGGLQVEAPSRVALGNSVLLRLEFDTEKLPAIQASAKVAWCSKIDRGRYRIGLQFHNLDDRSKDVITLYRQLLVRRSEADISTRTVLDDTDLVGSPTSGETGQMPSLQVYKWQNVPLIPNSRLEGYRRVGQVLQVRLRGGQTGVRCRDYAFETLRGMKDYLDCDTTTKVVGEFRFAEVGGGFHRFQFLDQEKRILLELEAKACSEQSTEQN